MSGTSAHCQGTSFSLSIAAAHCVDLNFFNNYIVSISDLILCEQRKSITELEVDVLAADILNRHELSLGRFLCMYNIGMYYTYNYCYCLVFLCYMYMYCDVGI